MPPPPQPPLVTLLSTLVDTCVAAGNDDTARVFAFEAASQASHAGLPAPARLCRRCTAPVPASAPVRFRRGSPSRSSRAASYATVKCATCRAAHGLLVPGLKRGKKLQLRARPRKRKAPPPAKAVDLASMTLIEQAEYRREQEKREAKRAKKTVATTSTLQGLRGALQGGGR